MTRSTVRFIPLTKGYEAIVDEADYHLVEGRLWHVKITRRSPGSVPHVHALHTMHFPGGRKRTVSMHRVILGATDGQQVDHANHNGLDNRRANLRFCTSAQNNANASRQSPDGLRGVNARGGKFIAQIQVNGRRHYSQRFRTRIEAAREYDRLARIRHGEFAVLNFHSDHAASPEQPA